jgi:hypothetical protein
MEPTYTTGDPMALSYGGDGLLMEVGADDRIGAGVQIPSPEMIVANARRARMQGYRGYGQMETGLPDVYGDDDPGVMYTTTSAGTGLLDSIGNALGNIIRTVGQQAPGLITGQPTSGQIYPGQYPQPSPLGSMGPLLLIGGGIALVYFLSKKR